MCNRYHGGQGPGRWGDASRRNSSHFRCRRLSGHPALVAQRIEHLTTDQKVAGSSPVERATEATGQGLATKDGRGPESLSKGLISHNFSQPQYGSSHSTFDLPVSVLSVFS